MFGVGVAIAAFEKSLVEAAWHRPRTGWFVLGGAVALLATRGPLGSFAVTGRIDPQLGIGLAGALPLTGIAVLIVLLIGWPVARQTMSVRPIVWLGERSYSLYLVHLPLVALLGVGFAVSRAAVWFVALCVASSLAVMVVFYRYVERPSAALASRFARRPRVERPEKPVPDDRREDEPSQKVPVGAY
jgi:peptidoglycan/LPS O-acetylase OafA/YrhL